MKKIIEKVGVEGIFRDCWCVVFGNFYNDEEWCVLVGYDNGDVKMFDFCMGKVWWEIIFNNGVCGIDFDWKDIKMNKFVCIILELKFYFYDLCIYYEVKGYLSFEEKLKYGIIVWGVKYFF